MNFVDLIASELSANEAVDLRRRLAISSTVAGVAHAMVLVVVNSMVREPERNDIRSLVVFIGCIAIFVVGARYTFQKTVELVENALHRLKTRIIDKIEIAELQGLERIGTSEIYDRVTENMMVISDSSGLLANCLQAACIILFAILYICWLSFPAFVLLLILFSTGVTLYFSKKKIIDQYLVEAAKTRLTFFDLITDLLRGFKETKYSRQRAREIRDDIVGASDALRSVTVKANNVLNDNSVFASCILFAMLGGLIFALPQYSSLQSLKLGEIAASVMFAWVPLGAAVSGFPAYVRSNQALAQIAALEAKLDAAVRLGRDDESTESPWSESARKLETINIEYEYAGSNDGTSFRIGPISMRATAGEVLFIVGGNGSGKSTFLRVLTGLYAPTSGNIRLNDIDINAARVQHYREQISAIYSDFHLFTKLYGLRGTEEKEVNRLIAKMQLEGKTSFAKQRFTKRDLSTGQRKRLAMIVTLLEDRPIVVFDEWAADQDPEFRRFFYEELLPELRAKGKIVIVITHDDRYFDCADQVLTMEYGKVRSVTRANRQDDVAAIPVSIGSEKAE